MRTVGARSHGTLLSCPGGWPGLLSGTHFRATLPLSHWAQHGDRPPRALWTLASVPPSCQSPSPAGLPDLQVGGEPPSRAAGTTCAKRHLPRTAPTCIQLALPKCLLHGQSPEQPEEPAAGPAHGVAPSSHSHGRDEAFLRPAVTT